MRHKVEFILSILNLQLSNCIQSVGITLLFSGAKKKNKTLQEFLVNSVTSQNKIYLEFIVIGPSEGNAQAENHLSVKEPCECGEKVISFSFLLTDSILLG